MSFLSKVFKSKDTASSLKSSKSGREPPAPQQPPKPKPKWEDAWARKDVEPEEVAELLHVCSQEMKSRALDTPFLLLPFRPNADPSAARNFIRNFFKNDPYDTVVYRGDSLRRLMRLVDPMVLCSIMKWCWSRLRGGVVGWNTYELFKTGENESKMAKNAFDTFIPLSVDSSHKKDIIFDFFDLMSAIAANGKTNGLGGRKLSRLSGWWAFDSSDRSTGFDAGYKSWENAAHATSHLFFAYLRARAPDDTPGSTGISQLPRSLQALVSQTEYPPETPILLLTSTPKVVMVVERVSSTPYALLRRARNFAYPETDEALQKYSDYEDPVRALTFECRRVLDCISSTNQSVTVNHETSMTSPGDTSWSRFEDLGFSSVLDEARMNDDTRGYNSADNVRAPKGKKNDLGRPTTPSWADFLSSGFADDSASRGPGSLLLPPEEILPPLNPQRVQSSQSHVRPGFHDDSIEPGELSYVNRIELDETFWWVWMTSLAGEETPARKAVFGRCALVETEIRDAKWLVMEEQMRGAAIAPDTNATVIQKRGRFGLSIRGRPRRSSLGKKPPIPQTKTALAASASTPALPRGKAGAEQKAKVQAAAAEIVRQQRNEQEDEKPSAVRRGRLEPTADSKTNSVMTLGLGSSLQSEAGPAMQWARKFDKETIRSRYLGDNSAGTGASRAPSPATTTDLISATKPVPATETAPVEPSVNAASSPEVPSAPVVSTTTHARDESEKTTTSVDDTHQTPRKPVAKSDSIERSAAPQTPSSLAAPIQPSSKPSQLPAAAAAAAAMRITQPAPNQNGAAPKPEQPASKPPKTGGTRKFKSLFNRKKGDDSEEPEALAKHREMSARKKQEQAIRQDSETPEPKAAPVTDEKTAVPAAVAVPVEAAAPAAPAAAVVPAAPVAPAAVSDEEMEAGEPGPTVESNEPLPPATHDVAKTDFTQGPLEDQPALVHDHIAAEEPTPKTSGVSAIAPEHVAPVDVKDTLEEHELADDEFSASSVAPSTATPANGATGSNDAGRWTQIRKNAAERKSEDQPTSPSTQRMSQTTEKTDDGETSGEETIEQRVARIRARVAQLTGNATGDPTAQVPPTS